MKVLSTIEKETYAIYYTINKLYFYLQPQARRGAPASGL